MARRTRMNDSFPMLVNNSDKEKIVLSWSGGKDSVLALHEILRTGRYEVEALLVNVIEETDRIAMHDVPVELIEQQAKYLGHCLRKIYLPKTRTNEQYLARVGEVLLSYKAKGVHSVAFGDLFLEDIKQFREKSLMAISMKGLYPIWSRDTAELARNFIESGFKAMVICVDDNVLGRSFVGRLFDHNFLNELPPNVDPCGENGEFHTFVFDGPLFRKPVLFHQGTIEKKDRFYFCDLVPA